MSFCDLVQCLCYSNVRRPHLQSLITQARRVGREHSALAVGGPVSHFVFGMLTGLICFPSCLHRERGFFTAHAVIQAILHGKHVFCRQGPCGFPRGPHRDRVGKTKRDSYTDASALPPFFLGDRVHVGSHPVPTGFLWVLYKQNSCKRPSTQGLIFWGPTQLMWVLDRPSQETFVEGSTLITNDLPHRVCYQQDACPDASNFPQ